MRTLALFPLRNLEIHSNICLCLSLLQNVLTVYEEFFITSRFSHNLKWEVMFFFFFLRSNVLSFSISRDIIKIDSYCKRRYIELVPHIESLSGFSQW